MSADLPDGTVTFLFTDIEGSTRLWEQHPDGMKAALARHDELLRHAVQESCGHIVKTTGDGCYAVFRDAEEGLTAARTAQQALLSEAWPSIQPDAIRARMALHTGGAELRDGDYFGPALNRSARLLVVGHGGQVLLSAVTAELVRDRLPAGVDLRDLGEHRLRDLVRPEHVFQLVAPGLPADFPPLRSLGAFPNNLPIQFTSFIGRQAEIAEVRRLLATTRLLTVTGAGGIGKTRLCLQLGGEVLTDFADGVWLVELAPLASGSLIAHTIVSVFSLGNVPGRSPLDLITDYLRAKRLLLILDNCEHLISDCARLAEHLLRACPTLKIVASSREALGIAGEVAFHLPSLSLPDTPAVAKADALMASEAVQLFVERAAAANPHFALSEHNAAAVAQICQRLDGIPLALELAAARVKLLTAEQIAARLDHRFRLLTGGSRTALPRQQTLKALIDWSYDLLPEGERVPLRQLSVFVGGWTFEAAEAVCPGQDMLDALAQLVNKSLVVVNEHGDEVRYHMLETIRQYAGDKLLDAGAEEVAAARDRHFDYFLHLSEQAEPALWQRGALEWVDRLRPDFDNILAAREWGAAHRPEEALRLTGNLLFMWVVTMDRLKGTDWLQEIMDRVAALPPAEGEAARRRAGTRAKGFILLGMLALMRGDYAAIREMANEAVTLERGLSDPFMLAQALGLLASTTGYFGDTAAMRDVIQESTALFRAREDHWWAALTLPFRVRLADEEGDQAARRCYHEEAQRVVANIDHPLLLPGLLALGAEARLMGDLELARSYYQQGFRLAQRMKSRFFEAALQSELVHVARQAGEFGAAKAGYRQMIVKWRDLGMRAAVANQLECLAFIARAEDQPARAARLLGAAEALRELIHIPMADYERPEYEREVAALRAQMDAAAFGAAWAEGRAMTLDQAVAYALQE
jgi:predicted ATPase/class 3 adenylate cyclase